MAKFQLGHKRAARLTATLVMEMRERYARGETQGSLARAFHLSVGQVGRIVRGESWQEYARVPTEEEIEHKVATGQVPMPSPADLDLLARLIDKEAPAEPVQAPEDYAESIRRMAEKLRQQKAPEAREEKDSGNSAEPKE